MKASHLLFVALFVLSAVVASRGEAKVDDYAFDYEAGDQFGAVNVCGDKAAFVGGFRVNREHRAQAELVSVSVGRDTASADVTPVTLPSAVDGGAVVAPGNGNLVYALAERSTTLQVFNLTDSCTSWSESTVGLAGAKRGRQDWLAGTTLYAAATIGSDAAVFAGGSVQNSGPTDYAFIVTPGTDGFDVAQAQLSQSRAGLAGVSTPSGAWFIGGMTQGEPSLTPSTVIDIITKTSTTSPVSLETARVFPAAAYAAGKVVVAGGAYEFYPSGVNTGLNFTNSVEVFDATTHARTTTTMPGPARGFMTATAVNDYIVFAGGVTEAEYDEGLEVVTQVASDAVDVYHVPSDTWATTTLRGGARLWASGVALEDVNAVIIAPGSYYNGGVRQYTSQSDIVYVYSAASSLSPMAWVSFVLSIIFF